MFLFLFVVVVVVVAVVVVVVVVVYRRSADWTMTWGGSGVIHGWGHNHRGQLGGIEGAKVKLPQPCEALSTVRPVQIMGGEQTLFAVTAEGRVSSPAGWFMSLIPK